MNINAGIKEVKIKIHALITKINKHVISIEVNDVNKIIQLYNAKKDEKISTEKENDYFDELRKIEESLSSTLIKILEDKYLEIENKHNILNKETIDIQKRCNELEQNDTSFKMGIPSKENAIFNFINSLKDHKDKFSKRTKIYSISLIIGLIILSALLNCTFFIKIISDSTWSNQLGIRLSLLLPSIAILSFIYSNYRLNRILSIRYRHVFDLVNYGHIYFEHILDDNNSRIEYMKTIINCFVELKHLSGIVKKEPNPVHEILTKLIKLINEQTDKSPIKSNYKKDNIE